MPLPWDPRRHWTTVFFAEETPLGGIVHEGLHAMGEHKVGDLYMDDRHPLTAGRWDIMDTGQFQGWDRYHQTGFPWQEDTGYSPSQPMGWVRAELWYRGRFRSTVATRRGARRLGGLAGPPGAGAPGPAPAPGGARSAQAGPLLGPARAPPPGASTGAAPAAAGAPVTKAWWWRGWTRRCWPGWTPT